MSSRYIRHSHTPLRKDELPSVRADILSVLNQYLSKIGEQSREQSRSQGSSVYIGSSGLALMRLYIPQAAIQPADSIIKSQLKSHSLRSPADGSHVSFLETSVGSATLVIHQILQGTTSTTIKSAFTRSTEILYSAVATSTSPADQEDDGCEVLYGRAGLLYALLRLRTAANIDDLEEPLSNIISDDAIASVISSIIERGKRGAGIYFPKCPTNIKPGLMWRWHGKRYLGAAHGVAGILHILLQAPRHLIEPHMSDIISTTTFLLELQDKTGNWPSKAPVGVNDLQDNELVQWCHGATGVVVFLSGLRSRGRRYIDSDMEGKIDNALADGARLVYRHGLLRKGLGLCHGVAGSIFGLLAVSKATNDMKHLYRAAHLAYLGTQHAKELVGIPDRPWSLYEGLSGMCCAWFAVLHCLEVEQGDKFVGMPGFDDIAG